MRAIGYGSLLALLLAHSAWAQAEPEVESSTTATLDGRERLAAKREAGCCHSLLVDKVIDRGEHDRRILEGSCCARLTNEYEEAGGEGPIGSGKHNLPSESQGPVLSLQRIFQVITMLGAVVLLAYVVLGRLLPRFLKIEQPLAARKLMTVIDRLPIDQRRSIMVLKVGAHYYLVGAAEGGISLLSRLDADEIAALLAERENAEPRLSKLASSWLSRSEKRT